MSDKSDHHLSCISIRGANEHNLKNIDIDIPRHKLVVISGVSGSGKSSLAFDTIYSEGRRRYMESLSLYARQFLENHNKPDVKYIGGLSPAIAIDQKGSSKNSRSTVATATEIYDYIRVLFASIAVPYSPFTGKMIKKQNVHSMMKSILELPSGSGIDIFAPIARGVKGSFRKELVHLKKQNFAAVHIDGKVYSFDDLPILDKSQDHYIDVLVGSVVIDEDEANQKLKSDILVALREGRGVVKVVINSLVNDQQECSYKVGEQLLFSERFACPESGFVIGNIEPRLFSFNNPYGACPKCNGAGTELYFNPDLIIADQNLSITGKAIAPWVASSGKSSIASSKEVKFYMQMLEALAQHYKFDVNAPWSCLSNEVKDIIMYGSKGEEVRFYYDNGFTTKLLSEPFIGVIPYLIGKLEELGSSRANELLKSYQSVRDCSSCHGHRLRQEALCIKILGYNVGEIASMNIDQSIECCTKLKQELSPKDLAISKQVIEEIEKRLIALKNVGLHYLTLNRRMSTLSGGEIQRIKLVTQIGSALSGVLYVLDEPSIGLHQKDNAKLLQTLKYLRDLGNSVVVVEHDIETIQHSDYLIDIGPGAGTHGGNVIAHGTPYEVSQDPNSITGKYISGQYEIVRPDLIRSSDPKRMLSIRGANGHNLKNIDVDIPLSLFTVVTGVSGSGKSTLIIKTLYHAVMRKLHDSDLVSAPYDHIAGLEHIDKVIEVDQSPIGRTPRSNPATYIGVFGCIRDLFASLPESQAMHYTSSRFSFNVKEGVCESCEGDGVVKVEMHFLSDILIECEECHGKRYNRDTLQIKYMGKSIADVLSMTIDEAVQFFSDQSTIYQKLLALQKVGLGYMKMGQSATTISGGEAQRIKLAKELSKKSGGNTLYILDEPTTGLHSHDISRLLKVLHQLVDDNNTVIVIEHNLDVIKNADYIVDIGPSGGDDGGYVMATGSPRDIAEVAESATGQYLKKMFDD